jgi:uncharacterized protein
MSHGALIKWLFTIFLFGLSCSNFVAAQEVSQRSIDESTVGIVTGPNGDLSARLAADLAAVLDEGKHLRVLAVAGRGGISDIADLLFLHGIGFAILPANTVYYAQRNKIFPNLLKRIRLISRLYIQTAHLVAGPGINSLDDLQGKKINVVSEFHNAFVTARTSFDKIGIKFEPVFLDQRQALEEVKNGNIAATLILSGSPSPLLKSVKTTDGLKLLNIPFNKNLPKVYFPTSLTNEDYPNLIPLSQTVNSIGTTALLVVYNFDPQGPRYGKVARFVDAFLSNLKQLQKHPRHPKWRDINLSAKVVGLPRFEPVTHWLKKNKQPVFKKRKERSSSRSVRRTFEDFIDFEVAAGRAEALLRANKKDLFIRYLAWRKGGGILKKNATAKSKSQGNLSDLFEQFISSEVGRIGQDKVIALTKNELFRRFLVWRQVNLVAEQVLGASQLQEWKQNVKDKGQ